MSEDTTLDTCPELHCSTKMPANEYVAWELHRIRHDLQEMRVVFESRTGG